jgi:hypothetical protein
VANVALLAYSEGYRGFQKSFAPRVIDRCRLLWSEPGQLRGLLAPLFCVGYFQSTRSLKKRVYAATTAIVVAIILIDWLPQPWRGIIDAGVVVGLTWGILSILGLTLRTVLRSERTYSAASPTGSD